MSANVLVQTAFLGDLLLSIPLMRNMRSLWPEEKLILVCRKGLGDFFLKTRLVDRVFEINKGNNNSYKVALKALESEKITRVFAPHESLRTAFFARRIQAQERIAFSSFWNFIFYNSRMQKNKNLPEALRQLSLLQNYDLDLKSKIKNFSYDPHQLSVVPSWASMSLVEFYRQQSDAIETVFSKVGCRRKFASRSLAIFPGSVWQTKRWTQEGFVQVGQELQNRGWQLLIMGGPGEEELCTQVAGAISGAINICGMTSIFESALILSEVAGVIGNDSASMHLAATADSPSVAIFGPTVLDFGYRPWQNFVAIVEKKGLKCRPCGKHGHRACPLGTHECMRSISKDDVLIALEKIL